MKPKLTELTPKQKRTLCAEACGWREATEKEIYDSGLRFANEVPRFVIRRGDLRFESPKYHTSLDAMAEAEATLTDDKEREGYVKWLNRLHPTSGVFDADSNAELAREIFHIVSATASQRLDAFLLAKGLAE